MENQVEMLQGSVPDDAAQAPAEQEGESLSSVLEEPAAPEQAAQEQDKRNDAPPAKEPGWIKQRIEKAVSKATREAEERVAARYEAILAPIRADVMAREAKELVESGEFKSLERAKEYVALKHGAPMQQEQQEKQENQAKPAPQRNAQGQFVPRQEQSEADNRAVIRARSELLAKQAQKIKSQRGVDVMQAFNADPQVKERVLSGEWDFYDVAESLSAGHSRVPAPMRATNGSGMTTVSVADMSPEQFKRLQANLAAGRIYDMRK